MSKPVRESSQDSGRLRFAFHGINSITAVIALAWTCSVATSIFHPTLGEIAAHLSRGESYNTETLRHFTHGHIEDFGQYCDPKLWRNLLLIQLRIATDSLQSHDTQGMDLDVEGVARHAKELLGCSPSESLAWLALYWSEIHQAGFGPKALVYLTQSYVYAPHEAWIQLLRVPLALRSSSFLTDFVRRGAQADFEDIFRAQLFPSAALIYKSAATEVRAMLLDRICDYSQGERLTFRHYVGEQGLVINHKCFPPDDRASHMRE